MIIIKIVLGILAYMICGSVVLEIVKWHDRKADWSDEWLINGDEADNGLVTVLWPFVVFFMLVYFLAIKFPAMFAKAVRTIATAAAYTIKAYFTGEDNEK